MNKTITIAEAKELNKKSAVKYAWLKTSGGRGYEDCVAIIGESNTMFTYVKCRSVNLLTCKDDTAITTRMDDADLNRIGENWEKTETRVYRKNKDNFVDIDTPHIYRRYAR